MAFRGGLWMGRHELYAQLLDWIFLIFYSWTAHNRGSPPKLLTDGT